MAIKRSLVFLKKSQSAVYNQVDFKNLLENILIDFRQNNIQIPDYGNVFIKPNVVTGDSSISSITTDPHFIQHLIKLLYEYGVSNVYVGDSSASFLSSENTFRTSGLMDAVKSAGGIYVNIDDASERVMIPLEGSDILSQISVPKKAVEADFLINFSKIKTHRVGSFTCCVKNYVGYIDQRTRLENHQTRLPMLVAQLHKAMPSLLCFGDGVIVGEGDGPDLSNPRFLGVLLGSTDPVALDVIGAQLLGISHNELIFPWTAHSEGVGEIDPTRITVIGENPLDLSINIKRPNSILYNRFPCNFALGGVCDGCFAWIMGPALYWNRDGIWKKMVKNVGTPTLMLGFNAVDRNFEKHLKEGPYFVIGDCTPKEFQDHPETIFIPGCCPGPLIPKTILNYCHL